MTIYNVLTGVCELIEADDPGTAVYELNTALQGAGFTIHAGRDQQLPDTFESEDGTEASTLPAPGLPQNVRTDLQALLDYNWSSEAADYERNPDPRHIFLAMTRLRDFLAAARRPVYR
jgi:hypothetical protein